MNSPLERLRFVQRFCPIILVCRCERFLTAPLREKKPRWLDGAQGVGVRLGIAFRSLLKP
jgi:hypothetical protein